MSSQLALTRDLEGVCGGGGGVGGVCVGGGVGGGCGVWVWVGGGVNRDTTVYAQLCLVPLLS